MTTTEQNTEGDIMSRKMVAELFQVSQPTLKRWEAKGLLKPIKLGPRMVRYYRSDIVNLLNASRIQARA